MGARNACHKGGILEEGEVWKGAKVVTSIVESALKEIGFAEEFVFGKVLGKDVKSKAMSTVFQLMQGHFAATSLIKPNFYELSVKLQLFIF